MTKRNPLYYHKISITFVCPSDHFSDERRCAGRRQSCVRPSSSSSASALSVLEDLPVLLVEEVEGSPEEVVPASLVFAVLGASVELLAEGDILEQGSDLLGRFLEKMEGYGSR